MKVTKSDFGYSIEKMSGEQKVFMENILGTMCDVVNKANEGMLTQEDMKAQFESINEQLKGYDANKFAQVIKDNEELREMLKKSMDVIAKAQEKGGAAAVKGINRFAEKVGEMFDSEKFKEFLDGHSRKSGVFEGFSLKDIVSMTDNYTGDVLISQQQPRVVSPYTGKKLHMRDVLTSLAGDPQFPQLAYTEITALDRNAAAVSENGMLPESSFSLKENTVGTKRIGTHLHISKRMLKSRAFVQSYIVAMLPEAVYNAEDWNILFGDGNGENFEGIANKQGVKPIETLIGTAVATGIAGSVKAVTAYNSTKGVVVEFTDAHPEILDGMKIQFSGATKVTGLNSVNDVIKMNDRMLLFPEMTFPEAETTVSAMTWTVKHGAYQSIEAPNSLDVIKTAFAVMTYANYAPTAIVLNPITVNAIESEKDTLGRNLGLVENVNGVKTIGGRPIVEYTGIPAGKYLLGDFGPLAAALVDYTNLTLEFAEDVYTKLTNQVAIIAQEEVIFPIYNPWAFAYGDLAALKTAITAAS